MSHLLKSFVRVDSNFTHTNPTFLLLLSFFLLYFLSPIFNRSISNFISGIFFLLNFTEWLSVEKRVKKKTGQLSELICVTFVSVDVADMQACMSVSCAYL